MDKEKKLQIVRQIKADPDNWPLILVKAYCDGILTFEEHVKMMESCQKKYEANEEQTND